MKIKLKEQKQYEHIHVDAENRVHLLIPLAGGTLVGTDNTCTAYKEIQQFFNTYHPKSGHSQVALYIRHLEKDVALLTALDPVKFEEIIARKQTRLKQLKSYQTLELATRGNHLAIDRYPASVHSALSDYSQNCATLLLAPKEIDHQLAFHTAPPIFSLNRSAYSPWNVLWDRIVIPPRAAEDTRTRLINIAMHLYQQKTHIVIVRHEEDLIILRGCLVDAYCQLDPNAEGSKPDLLLQVSCDQRYPAIQLDYKRLMDDNFRDSSVEGMATYLARYTFKDEYLQPLDNALPPFSPRNLIPAAEKERLSICVQLFLGIACAYHYSKTSRRLVDFGKILDRNPRLRSQLAFKLQAAFNKEGPREIEDALIDFLQTHTEEFRINAFTADDIRLIKARFNEIYQTIQFMPHFDEFLLFLPEAATGDFYQLRGRITLHAARYVKGMAANDFYQGYFDNYDASPLAKQPNESKPWLTNHQLPNNNLLEETDTELEFEAHELSQPLSEYATYLLSEFSYVERPNRESKESKEDRVVPANNNSVMKLPVQAFFDDRTYPAQFKFATEAEAKAVYQRLNIDNDDIIREGNLIKMNARACQQGNVGRFLLQFYFSDRGLRDIANYLSYRAQFTSSYYSFFGYLGSCFFGAAVSREQRCNDTWELLMEKTRDRPVYLSPQQQDVDHLNRGVHHFKQLVQRPR